MPITASINYDDLRARAKRYVPRIAFDFMEGGVDDERGLQRNADAFHAHALLPRYLVDASKPNQSTVLFGQTFAQPFGIAPTGGASLFRQGADLMLARAAKAANVPFIISGASTATMEEVASIAKDHSWYQLYLARDRAISRDMVARALTCGFTTLVLSVDIPAQVRRERNLRNGFGRPMNPTWSAKLEALTHPSWLLAYYTGADFTASNWLKYAPVGAKPHDILEFLSTQFPVPSTWEDVAWIRKMWPGKFVIKGILSPDDARRAVGMGADGLMISNHGGRQLDRAPSPLEVLPAIVDAVGDTSVVMFDSGIRRGSDIVTALALGAKFCFVGRWTLYGVAAGAEAGAAHALSMIATEVGSVMTQIGATDVAAVGPQFLMWDKNGEPGRNRRP